MKKIYLFILTALIASCRQSGQFCVTGHITDAADTVMYLEHISLGDGIEAIDSVRLDESGAFELKGDTMPTPEFYRLRIGGQCINLAIDSTETVSVEASMKDMSFGYTVTGSGTCDTIRILCLKLAELEKSIKRVADNRDYTIEERNEMIDELVQQYKTEIKMEIIQNRYDATASYFVCFQMLGGQLLFNPLADRSDLTWIRAVANAWNEKYPGSQRTENLYNIVMEGQRLQAKPREIVIDTNHSKVRELGIIDMTFPDVNGTEHTLSDLKGKVVLLDFTAIGLKGAPERTLQLRELYDRYHDRGLEIYQVCVDPDRHFWAQRCDQLPWVCVYCEEGLNSDILMLYNIQQLPTYFLIDRNCDLKYRQDEVRNLRTTIESLL
ncbi:MAG: DUF4369 domain-containing protein [Paraprevotella sp.]|nr:DUF4369 domain-containing protein [Paraprevotella sp.]